MSSHNVKLLEEAGLFEDLSEDMLEKIGALCREEKYDRRDTIYVEGEKTRELYLLDYGLVTLRVAPPDAEEKVMITAIRDRGEAFGWHALMKPHVHSATAIALEPTKLLVIKGPELMRLLEEEPESGFVVMQKVAGLIASRLDRTRVGLISALAPGLISHG